MYRFRKVENLIGEFQELEKQQIYFADLEELNDPVEGMRRYFWQGDKIVWENFFKHYLLCLEHVILLARLLPDEEIIEKKDIPIFKSENDLPSEIYKERIKKINRLFFSNQIVQSCLNFMIKNPNKVYIDEMYVHLTLLSNIAISTIFEIDVQEGLMAAQVTQKNEIDFDLNNMWNGDHITTKSSKDYNESIEALHNVIKSRESALLIMYKDSPKLQSIYIEFTQMYLDSILELTYPKAYVACFMDNCSDSSIWGTYGNNHTGVCLKFKVKDESNPFLPLKTITGFNSRIGNTYDYVESSLQPIDYSSDFRELDFFKNIGRLTLKQLEEQWYTNENGEVSICGEQLFTSPDKWRAVYWSEYDNAYLKKTPAWAHEKEYRIVISSALGSFDDAKDRALEYKFENLEAIVFGLKTPLKERFEIIEMVVKKCKELEIEQFDFFEMAFSKSTGNLFKRKLQSVKKGQLQF